MFPQGGDGQPSAADGGAHRDGARVHELLERHGGGADSTGGVRALPGQRGAAGEQQQPSRGGGAAGPAVITQGVDSVRAEGQLRFIQKGKLHFKPH